MILHIPHASAVIPTEVRNQFTIDDHELAEELLRSTDWFTDELFAVQNCVAVTYPVSRIVADPERFESDEDEAMSRVGRGVVYFNRSNGKGMRRSITNHERESLLATFYRPHHRALEEITARALNGRGSALIVDAHSFPDLPWRVEPCQDLERPDFCLGSDPFHTPPPLLEIAEAFLAQGGLSVAVNRPYAGTLVPSRYYQKNKHVLGVMIEVNRRLYMNEETGAKNSRFPEIASAIQSLGLLLRDWHAGRGSRILP